MRHASDATRACSAGTDFEETGEAEPLAPTALEAEGETNEGEGAGIDEVGVVQAELNPQYAVGIAPLSVDGGTFLCPSDSASVSFVLDTNDGSDSWDSGWVLPSYTGTTKVIRRPYNVRLNFCKVSGEVFKPIKRPGSSSYMPYAVLKMGTFCPQNSREARRYIDTEDYNNKNSYTGDIAPNAMNKYGVGFVFCVFTSPVDASTEMTAFPNYNVPYGVFHDYGDPVGGIVLAKRQIFTNDENSSNANSRWDGDFATAFRNMIEGTTDTYFELAQVR